MTVFHLRLHRISQPWCHWHLGPDGGCPGPCVCSATILCLYTLDANSSPQSDDQKCLQMLLNDPGENLTQLREEIVLYTWKWKALVAQSCLFATPWSVAHQAPLSMGFSRQEYGVGWYSLCQGIFLTQRPNLGPLHCRLCIDICVYKDIYI